MFFFRSDEWSLGADSLNFCSTAVGNIVVRVVSKNSIHVSLSIFRGTDDIAYSLQAMVVKSGTKSSYWNGLNGPCLSFYFFALSCFT
jgi:hypothetical protein